MFKFEWRSGPGHQYFSTCDSSGLLWNVFFSCMLEFVAFDDVFHCVISSK